MSEASAQLSGVAEDRDQRSDRGRGHRRAGVEQGEHDPCEREQPADREGERDRHQPADRRELERLAADALEVDLVAREEEQHPEPEVGEEGDELVCLSEVEQLRSDQDSEHDLDSHDRERQAARDAARNQRGERGRRDDREE